MKRVRSSLWIHSGGATPVAVSQALAQSRLRLVIWPHFEKYASLFRGRLSLKGAGWELTRTSFAFLASLLPLAYLTPFVFFTRPSVAISFFSLVVCLLWLLWSWRQFLAGGPIQNRKQLLGERLRILCVAWDVCRVHRGSPKALL